MKKYLLALILYIGFSTLASAATCFWVGGTGTFSTSNTASWSSATGPGGGGTCAATGGIPKQAADTATFDANSGGGTVTVDSTMNGATLTTITAGTFTGTLDFDANDPSMTLTGSLSFSGTGARKFLMGSGTFTFTGNGASVDLGITTNLDPTSDFSAASYVITGNTTFTRSFGGGGRSFGPVTIGANTNRGAMLFSGANTYASLSLAAGTFLQFGTTGQTITTAPTWTGTSSNPIFVGSSNPGTTITVAIGSGTLTCDWCGFQRITTSGGTARNATNSLDFGNNSGTTITPPSGGGGGGGRIIGG